MYTKFMQIVIEALLGTMLTCFVLLPTALFTMGNPRLNDTYIFFMYEYLDIYLEIIRFFIFPSDTMCLRSFLVDQNFASMEIYLPFVGIVLLVPYIINNKKSWITKLFFISLIFMFVPILNSSFLLFKDHLYFRWIYMPCLIISLASSICLDKSYDVKKGVKFTFILYILLIILIFCFAIGTV